MNRVGGAGCGFPERVKYKVLMEFFFEAGVLIVRERVTGKGWREKDMRDGEERVGREEGEERE